MKKLLFLLGSLIYAAIDGVYAQNLITNGDLESSDLTSFRVNDYVNGKRRELQEPRIISDNSQNHFIIVTSQSDTNYSYDSQLFLTCNKPFQKGCCVNITMRAKADLAQHIGIQLHYTPSNFVRNEQGEGIYIPTEWTDCSYTICINDDNIQTFAFNISNGSNNNLYFDDINVEINTNSTVDILPNPDYGNAWKTAYDFLVDKGIKAPNLVNMYKTQTMLAFSDKNKKCFVLLASDEVSKYLDDPILAYSLGESVWSSSNKNDDNTIDAILKQYDLQLTQLCYCNEFYEFQLKSIYSPKPEGVSPILGDISYNQNYPYNKLFPLEKNDLYEQCIAGCGSVAMAQVLSYYHHPVKLRGKTVLTSKKGKKYKVRLSKYPIKWDGTEDDIAAIIYNCAASVRAIISPKATSSSIDNIRSALVKYWGYSRDCTLMKDYYDYSTLASIYHEIDNGRPVIVSDRNHAFVCDGYENDYLHYNLGWGGYCNGYYRVMIVSSMGSKSQLPFKNILVGIAPRK